MTDKEAAVLRAYLCDSLSHRDIQIGILGLDAPARGGGFKTMEILHKYGIKGDHKGILKGRVFDRERFERAGNINNYLAER